MNVYHITPLEQQYREREMHEIYRLRDKVLNGQLNWNLPTVDGLECDQFDQDCHHFYVLNNDADLVGTVRFVPTVKPHLTSDVFGHLLGDRPRPNDPAIWDLSRFAIDKWAFKKNLKAYLQIQAALTCAVYEFMVVNGIAEILTVQTPSISRAATVFLGQPEWKSNFAANDAPDSPISLSYAPNLERLYTLRAKYNFPSPILSSLQSQEVA